MTKEYIALYDNNRTPHSLGHIVLKEGKYVEDIFDAVATANTIDEITANMEEVVVLNEVEATTDSSTTMSVLTTLGMMHLKVRVATPKQ